MKFYISANGVKRVTISGAAAPATIAVGRGQGAGGFRFWEVMKGKGYPAAGVRRVSHRTVVLPVMLVLALLLPFLFVRLAFVIIESATICSSSLDCMRWRFFGGSDSTLLREELTRAMVEAASGESKIGGMEGSKTPLPESFEDLVLDMTSSRQDIKAFAFKTKAMVLRMENMLQSAKRRESIYWHLASHGVPKSIHCLALKLAEEYAVNATARSPLPLPEFVSRLTDPSFHHIALLTDNVLAASVTISSTVKSSINPEKLVFHIVTDKKTYTPMHAWFAVNSIHSAVVEVKGLHQYDWSHEINVGVKEMLEIHRLIWKRKYDSLKEEDLKDEVEQEKDLEVLSPSYISLLNHLRIYIPELFPDLNKIVFLDDDIVVQHDLSSLWDLDLNGKVIGAVVDSWCGHDCCPGRKYKDYFNFTNPIISSNFHDNRCGWVYGMNIFDLQMWRATNITATYHRWLKLNLNSGFALWHPGALPPALIAFQGHVHRLDPSWHVAGLGHRFQQIDEHKLEAARVIHFSGPAKPWLKIAAMEARNLWNKHVNFSNEFIRKCGIIG